MKRYYSYLRILFSLISLVFASITLNASDNENNYISQQTSVNRNVQNSQVEGTTGADLIPANPFLVASINIEKMINATGINENKLLLDKINQELEKSNMPQNVKNNISALIQDPNQCGINISKPIFISSYGDFDDPDIIFTGTMWNKNKFENFINYISEGELVIHKFGNSGIRYIEIDNKSVILYNSQKFIIGVDKKKNQSMYSFISKLSKAFSLRERYSNTNYYKHLKSYNGFMNLNFSIGEILKAPQIKKDIITQNSAQEFIKFYNNLNKSELLISLNMPVGKATFDIEFIPNSLEIDNFIKNNSYTKASTGKFLPLIPNNTLLTMSTNFNGEKFMDFVKLFTKSDLKADKYLNLIKGLFSTVNGDITAVFNGNFSKNGKYPEFTVYSETSNSSIAQIIASINPNIHLNKTNEWAFNLYDYNPSTNSKNISAFGTFGFNSYYGATYFNLSSTKKSLKFTPVTNHISATGFTNNVYYARLNFSSILDSDIMPILQKKIGKEASIFLPIIINEFDYAELKGNSFKSTLNIYMRNSDKTPIQTFVDLLTPFLIM